MNKEQQELLDKVYKKYRSQTMFHIDDLASLKELDGMNMSTGERKKVYRQYAPVEFIDKCKTDTEFSEKWGLKIEERELSHDERFRIAYKNLELRKKLEAQSKMLHYPDGHNKVMDDANIPTKLITITYNDKTIESYE
jgi:hypothetical protein